jgi:preprotein translocase subunit SecF
MFILKNSKLFLSISALAVLLSLVSIFAFGLKKNIDFTGGTKVVANFGENIISENVQSSLSTTFQNVKVTTLANGDMQITLKDLSENEYAKLRENIQAINAGKTEIKEFSVIGPSISSEIVKKAVIGFILVALAIILFITFSFWGIGENRNFQVSSFKYGLVTIAALLHDILIPTGVFAFLGYMSGVEVDSLFVVALLTILGVSVSDTIVVFDRVRENIKNATKGESFYDIVGKSLNQSFVRSLATSVSVIAVLLALVFWGPDSTKYFAITLTIGMFVGTYSSLFVASPLLVLAQKYWPSKMESK